MVAQRDSIVRGRLRRVLPPHLWVALPLLALAPLVATGGQRAQARPLAPSDTNFTIINPSALAGPVGTNVTAKITGEPKGHVFNIAYAQASPGCSALGASATTLPQVTIGSDGTAQFSFAWPADSGTGTFVLCAQDQKVVLTVLQTQQSFTVDSTTPPAISIQPAPQPTPTGQANATNTPAAQNGYIQGESVVVQGTGFLPGGTSVQVALSSTPNSPGTQLSQGAVNADTSGNFTTTVTLNTNRIGNLYIQAFTTDGGTNQPPSLLASTPITVTIAPQPTATPQPSPTPTATVGPTPTQSGSGQTGGTSPNDSTLHILGIAGLGSFSVLLLLVGTALLISAGGGRDGQS
jgi:hypothetical protein